MPDNEYHVESRSVSMIKTRPQECSVREVIPIVQAKIKNVIKNKLKWTNTELGELMVKVGADWTCDSMK